jgi:hypothetical protein
VSEKGQPEAFHAQNVMLHRVSTTIRIEDSSAQLSGVVNTVVFLI